jgi:hypothetical protein
MLNILRNRMPDLDEARDMAADGATKAADIAAQAAKEASGYLEEWAADGLESIRERPLTWSAASLGVGMAIGGLLAVWAKLESSGRSTPRTMAARSRTRKSSSGLAKAKRPRGTRRALDD